MTIKERILHWLDTPTRGAVCNDIEIQIVMERRAITEGFDKKLAEIEARHKADIESRAGLVLEAAMSAADKIARAVAQRGDSNLKEYVDAQLEAFQSAVQWHN
jgi:hypothetical protein